MFRTIMLYDEVNEIIYRDQQKKIVTMGGIWKVTQRLN